MADPGRDGLGVPDVQRQARPAEAGAELAAAQERREAAGAGQQVDGLADDGSLEGFAGRAGAWAGRAGFAAGGVSGPLPAAVSGQASAWRMRRTLGSGHR